jgi:hypothetical protein
MYAFHTVERAVFANDVCFGVCHAAMLVQRQHSGE